MRTKIRTKISILMLILSTCCFVSGFAQLPLNYAVENSGESCGATASGLITSTTLLPNPFQFHNGTFVKAFSDWECRRNEIKADVEKYEIGAKPKRPTNITATYAAGKLTVVVTENGKTLTLTSSFTVPSGTGPFPIVIGMNAGTGTLSSSLFTGIVQVPFMHDQVCTYGMGGAKDLNAPFYKMYPSLSTAGDYCGWSWGVSRLIDGLEIVAKQLNLDMTRIAVTGCSYAGKMALFAGTFDERVTLTIAQESGGGGINSWRLSDIYAKRVEDIEKINNTNGNWFMRSMLSLDPYKLPHDHHELIAMCAPRAFLALGNPPYGWLGDESGYKSCMAALEVWKAMGIEDRFGFDFTGGHDHCSAAASQNTSVTAFVDKFLRNKTTVNTKIRIVPVRTEFKLDYATAYDWEPLPTLTTVVNPNAPSIVLATPAKTSIEINETLTLNATVTDPNNDVKVVEFYVNDVKVGEDVTAPYSFQWTKDAAGVYAIKAKVTDLAGNTATSLTISITVTIAQAPYGGTAWAIPGTVQFENFDVGGNGVAYNDGTPGSAVTPVVNFRTTEDVDIETCTDASTGSATAGASYNLGYTMAGEWTEYTVNVAAAGTYTLTLRVACSGTGRTVSLSAKGVDIATDIAIPNTGGWQTWQDVVVKDVKLDAGVQVLRLSIGATDYVNLNYMSFASGTVVAPASIKLKAGWNIVGCPIAGSTDIATALSSVWSNVEVVKSLDAFYLVGNPAALNLLNKLNWGQGYMVKVKADCSLTWIK